MTTETVNYNLERLRIFIGGEKAHWPVYSGNEKEATPEWLLSNYGRMLDIYGCPRNILSRILLPLSDYMELQEWIFRTHKWLNYQNENGFAFEYGTFMWDIIKVKTINP